MFFYREGFGGDGVARIGVDDVVYGDIRFRKLCRLLKNEDEALGLLIRFWRSAQTFWADGKLIPENDFNLEGFSPIYESGLAEKTEKGYYAKGSERFNWYKQKCEASKAAASKRKRGRPKKISDVPETQIRETALTPTVHPKLNKTKLNTTKLNYSSKGALVPEKKEILPASPPSLKSSGHNLHQLIAVYINAYKAAYNGARPDVGGKAQGALNRLLKDYSVEKLSLLIQVYCQMRDNWIVTKHHDLITFENNLNKILYAFEHGKERTKDDLERERKQREDLELRDAIEKMQGAARG